MKILHIGVMANGKDEGLSKSFRKLASEYQEINAGDTDLQKKALAFNFDLCFVQIQSDTIAAGNTVEVLNPIIQKGFTINWSGDMRNETPKWMLDLPADVRAFSNQKDVNYVRSKGKRAEFLQIGIDAEIFTNKGNEINGKDIVFFANSYGRQFPLSEFRTEVARLLKATYGKRFGLYGNGFNHADGNYNVQGDDVKHWQGLEASIYRGCKIAVSVSHYDVERYTSDRLLRIMGCGAFPMVHNFKGIEVDFHAGVNLIAFDTYKSLVEKINYWLDSDRSAIQKNAHDLIHSKYTYGHMAQNIINMR